MIPWKLVAKGPHILIKSRHFEQIDARIENFEYLLEKYLGPRSYLKTNKAEDIADDFVDSLKNAYGKVLEKSSILSRGKRAVKKTGKVFSQVVRYCLHFIFIFQRCCFVARFCFFL